MTKFLDGKTKYKKIKAIPNIAFVKIFLFPFIDIITVCKH